MDDAIALRGISTQFGPFDSFIPTLSAVYGPSLALPPQIQRCMDESCLNLEQGIG